MARYKCFLCGGFKRKKPCSPFAESVQFYINKLSKYKKIYMIIARTDGTISWRPGIEKDKLVKKVNRGLKGAAKGMPLYLHKMLMKLREKKKCYILISGSCSLCRPCNINGPCLKGGFAHSPEGVGIDVINTLIGLGIKIEQIPYNEIVNVAMLFMGRKNK